MFRNLKALGLALVALGAISAIAVATASAHVPARFTGPVSSELVGEETVTNVFAVTGVETSCQVVSYRGVSPAGSESAESLTITPSYSVCTAESIIGTINVTVTGFGAGECDYVVNANGTTNIVCAAGKEVTIDAASCTIHIPAQNNLGTITYTTGLTSGIHDVTSHTNITNITTNHTDGFGCPLPSGGESATATYTGTWTRWYTKPAGVKVDMTWHATVA